MKDGEEEALLLYDQHNRREQYFLCVGVQGQYCWHGYARGEVSYQNLDVHSEDENLLLKVYREDLAAELELELELPWLVQPERVAGVMRDQMAVESEGDWLVEYQRWNPHLLSDYLPVPVEPIFDPSAEIPAPHLYGLCHHRYLVDHLVRDQSPWKE